MLYPVKYIGEFHQPLLIFGGPYSNYQATNALLEVAKKLGVPASHIICTGDIVAYAGEPERTTKLIKNSGIHVVMGNCEESLATDSIDCGCGFSDHMQCSIMAIGWYNYAQQKVSEAHKQWMGTLPRILTFTINGVSASVIHGGVDKINEFIFASTSTITKTQQWQQAQTDLVIGGHCGLPFGEVVGEVVDEVDKKGLWLNAGVIGLPANDGTPDVWYMLLTPKVTGVQVSWCRLPYDYIACQQQMYAVGLTDYASTMSNGLWPSMDVLPVQERQQQGDKLRVNNIDFL